MDCLHQQVENDFKILKKKADKLFGSFSCVLNLDPANFKNSKLLGYTQRQDVFLSLKACRHPDYQKIIAHELAHAVCAYARASGRVSPTYGKDHDQDFKDASAYLGGFEGDVIDEGFGQLLGPCDFYLWTLKFKPLFLFDDEHQDFLKIPVAQRKKMGLVYQQRIIKG